jgi:hypothetical protein
MTYGDAEQTDLYYDRSAAGPEDVPHSRYHLEESVADAPKQGNDLPVQSRSEMPREKKKKRLLTIHSRVRQVFCGMTRNVQCRGGNLMAPQANVIVRGGAPCEMRCSEVWH